MAEIDYTYLHELCSVAVSNAKSYNYFYHALYECQFNIGCRYIELYDLTRWQWDGKDYYTLSPGKGNKERTFSGSDLGETFPLLVQGDLQYVDFCRRAAFSRSFKKLFPIYPIWHGQKNVTSHIFRYNRIKWMYFNDRYSEDDIASWFGEVNVKNIQIYIDAKLEY